MILFLIFCLHLLFVFDLNLEVICAVMSCQTLYERILAAKTNSTSSETKWKQSKDTSSLDPYAR